MNNERIEAIKRISATLEVYRQRQAKRAIWTEEISDCEIMIARLQAGLSLTNWQRGKPTP
jgi:hypothetical protein